jgi:hypothetical protein
MIQKVISKEIEKLILFCWCVKDTGNARKEQDPVPDPDPLVQGTDPKIRIRTRMSRIRKLVIII